MYLYILYTFCTCIILAEFQENLAFCRELHTLWRRSSTRHTVRTLLAKKLRTLCSRTWFSRFRPPIKFKFYKEVLQYVLHLITEFSLILFSFARVAAIRARSCRESRAHGFSRIFLVFTICHLMYSILYLR